MNESLSAKATSMLTDVLAGLSGAKKSIPPMYFYDEEGSRIFDEITQLDEYYPTRTEAAIMQQHGADIGRTLGDDVLLIEYGSGSSVKTRILLNEMHKLSGYVPIDISAQYLQQVASGLQAEYPQVRIHPVAADFTQAFELPFARTAKQRRVVYFPGSTIGNFTSVDSIRILREMGQLFGDDGGALIGVDLVKSRNILVAAYNDAKQVTARFNLNLLQRMNREIDADFDVDQFRHQAIFDEHESRIEMHLHALQEMDVHIADNTFHFSEGESILTEYSHKYTLESFAQLADQAQLQVSQVWTDIDSLFSVQYLTKGTR
ncbi:MAG: dimethylhistidine N-methyltransferase [Gammaproteobacteria bacterium]